MEVCRLRRKHLQSGSCIFSVRSKFFIVSQKQSSPRRCKPPGEVRGQLALGSIATMCAAHCVTDADFLLRTRDVTMYDKEDNPV